MNADKHRWMKPSHGAGTRDIDHLPAVKRIPSPGAADEISAKDKNLLDQGEGEPAFSLVRLLTYSPCFAPAVRRLHVFLNFIRKNPRNLRLKNPC